MPIKGLTDRDSIQPRFPRIGKLRKGDEKVSDRKPGAELNYWRFTSDRDGAVEAFTAVFGSQPQRVQVYLPYAGVEENFQTWKEEWGAGSLKHRCDGETCTIWLGPDGCYRHDPKPCPGGCKEVGRLELIIPELFQAGHVGTVTMETHSLNDLISITETLMKTAELRGDNPLGLRGILFNLRRVPEQISVPGFGANAGKRQRVEKWLVKIEPAVDWVQAQMALARSEGDARELEAQARPALTVEVAIDDGDLGPGPDYEDGSETDPAEAPQPDTKPVRPFDAWTLATLIEESVTRRREQGDTLGPKLENFKRAVISNLESCFEQHQDQARHLVTEYLLGDGKGSSKAWDDAETLALHKWLGATEENGVWMVNDYARTEAQAAYREALATKGQQVMEF